jgi:hypothetical protein
MFPRCLWLAAALWAPAAGAEQWVRVGDDTETVHFVDLESLSRSGDVVRLLKRAVYRDPQPIGDTPGLPLIRESVGVVECDCVRFQHRAVSIRLISDDSREIWNSGDMRRVWESVDAGSPGRATLDFACARTAAR